MDYNKMKVNDLKAELAARNLDTKGVKAVLVERLKEAIEHEGVSIESNIEYTSTSIAAKKMDIVGTSNPSTPIRRSRRRSMTRSPSPVKTEVQPLESLNEEPEPETEKPICIIKKRRTSSSTSSPVKIPDTKREILVESVENEEMVTPIKANNTHKSPVKPVGTPFKQEITSMKQASSASPIVITPIKITDPAPKQDQQDNNRTKTPNKSIPTEDEPQSLDASTKVDEFPDVTITDQQSPQKEGETQDYRVDEEDSKAVKRKSSSSSKDTPNKTIRANMADTPIDFVYIEDEPEFDNNKFSLSWFDSDLNLEIDPKTFHSAKPISEGPLALVLACARANLGITGGKVAFEVLLTKVNETRKVTNEPISSDFRVGWSIADSNLQLGEDKYSFAYISSGSKAIDSQFSEYGVEYKVHDVIGVYLDMEANPCKIEYTLNNTSQGVAFEFERSALEGKALFPHICSRNIAYKVNFGQFERSLLNDRVKPKKKQIKSAGKLEASNKDRAINENTESGVQTESIKDAQSEKKAESGETVTLEENGTKPTETISEEKKSETQHQEKSVLKEQEEYESKELLKINSEFIYIAESPKTNIVTGISRPENRSDCEVIFMIGLPGSGKTTWVEKYLKQNPDRKYTILGVDALLDRMRLILI